MDQAVAVGADAHATYAIAFLRFSSTLSRKPWVVSHFWSVADQQGQVLRHVAGLDGVHTHPLQRVRELGERRIVVELGTMREPARPREDGGHRVGGGLLALLVLAEVTRDGAVRGLGLHRLAVGSQQHAGHQAERAEALCRRVGLHVAVVVLARPQVAARPLERGRHHVVDQAVLVGELPLVELGLELRVEHVLEDVLEAAVVDLEDGVLGRQVDRIVADQPVVEGGTGEVADRVRRDCTWPW